MDLCGKVAVITGGKRIGRAVARELASNGMNLVRIDSKMQPVVMGIVLIVSVALETWSERRRARG